jgi:hypothetical protein
MGASTRSSGWRCRSQSQRAHMPQYAADCRRLAEKAAAPDKQALLKIAEACDKQALIAEAAAKQKRD